MTLMSLRRLSALAAAVAGLVAVPVAAEAQSRRDGAPLILRVQPRSFLDPGRVAPVGSLNRYATQSHASHVIAPPYANLGDATVNLPDPVVGPFPGARNPFGPVDLSGILPR